MQEALSRITNKTASYVIDSVRTPGEVMALRANGDALLIAVDADPAIRFARAKAREAATGRGESALTYDEFLAREALENTDNPAGQQLHATANLADFVLLNNGSQADFLARVERVLAHMPTTNAKRPSWEEYFLEILYAVARRGNCDRGRSGAVLVRDKQVLATGYVGAPAGLPTCDQVGHMFIVRYDERGGTHQHCVRTTHAEANAIASAARRGVNIDGATLYVSMEPCLDCAKLLINAGVERVVCERRYHAGHDTREMLAAAGVDLVTLSEKEMEYGHSRVT
jgi:dCMP deaminase